MIAARVRRLHGDERGYTLMELLVVMTILGLVMGGLATIFVSGGTAELDLNRRAQAQDQARLALDRIRGDVHCASAAVSSASQSSMAINTYPALRLNIANCNASLPYAYWCVITVSTSPPEYQLWRTTASAAPTSTTCKSGDASRMLVADYLVNNTAFPATSAIPNHGLETVDVDFKVSVNPTAGRDVYELKDSIVVSNYTPRCATNPTCPAPTSVP